MKKRPQVQAEETRKKATRNPAYATIGYAFSLIQGGKDAGMRFAGMSLGNPENKHVDQMKAVIDLYWKLPPFERHVSIIDDLCEKVGIRPGRFLSECINEMCQYKMNVSEIVAAEAHVDAIQATARMAARDFGVEDRKMLYQHSGFLPQPRGATFNAYTSVNTRVIQPAVTQSGLPAFEDGVVATSSALRTVDSPALPALQSDSHEET